MPYGRSRSNSPRSRCGSSAAEHVAAVERRNRHHVEHRQQHVDRQRMTRSAAIDEPTVPLAPARRSPDAPRRRPPAAGCCRARQRRRTRSRAAGAQVAHVDRHRLRPADQRQRRSSIAISGNSTCRSDRRAPAGFSDTPPEHPRRRIAQPVGRPGVRRLVNADERQQPMNNGDRDEANLRTTAHRRACGRRSDRVAV